MPLESDSGASRSSSAVRVVVAVFVLLLTVTTTVNAGTFSYDVTTVARVDVREPNGAAVSPTQLKDAREEAASPHLEARGTPTTRLAQSVATEAGPLALNAGSEVSQWAGPTLSRVTQTEETMYRVWGGGSGQAGEWLTPINPASSAAARAGLALPEGNAATFVSEVLVPAGTRIQVGVAGEAFGQAGGWTQVRLLGEIPLSSFGKGVPLAP